MAKREVYQHRRLLRMRNALVAVIAIALALILSTRAQRAPVISAPIGNAHDVPNQSPNARHPAANALLAPLARPANVTFHLT